MSLFDLQTVAFWSLKNATKIADYETSALRGFRSTLGKNIEGAITSPHVWERIPSPALLGVKFQKHAVKHGFYDIKIEKGMSYVPSRAPLVFGISS